jgi:hypothetical protein
MSSCTDRRKQRDFGAGSYETCEPGLFNIADRLNDRRVSRPTKTAVIQTDPVTDLKSQTLAKTNSQCGPSEKHSLLSSISVYDGTNLCSNHAVMEDFAACNEHAA